MATAVERGPTCATPRLDKGLDEARLVNETNDYQFVCGAVPCRARPLWSSTMNRYVDSTEQLVTEIVVEHMRRSVDFYQRLGFELLRDGGDFVELVWEDHRLFLAELSAFRDVRKPVLPAPPAFPPANVRVMVSDVDAYWKRANELGARIVVPIADRYYGLRDFTIADPDGFGVRFASLLPAA